MPSKYPGALDALPTDKTNETTAKDDHAANHNSANEAINAVQSTLGADPQGSADDVSGRLGEIETSVAANDEDLTAHAADSTGIHGIADTANLVVKAEIAAKVMGVVIYDGGWGARPEGVACVTWTADPGDDASAPEGMQAGDIVIGVAV